MSKQYHYSLPNKINNQYQLGELIGAACALVVAEIAEQHSGPVILITQDTRNALRLLDEIQQFTTSPIFHFTDWDTLPYDQCSPHKRVISLRLSILYKLPLMQCGVLIVPISTLMQRVCPYSYLKRYTLIIKKGQQLSLTNLQNKLNSAGYHHMHQIIEHGEYAIHNNLLDLYPMGNEQPYRLSFTNNEINSLHMLNINTQYVMEEAKEIIILPAHEFPTDETAINSFFKWLQNKFNTQYKAENLCQQISKKILPAGIEYWQPMFFSKPLPTLFSYFPNSAILVNTGELKISAQHFEREIKNRYTNYSIQSMLPLLPPNDIWLGVDEVFNKIKQWPYIQLKTISLPNEANNINLAFRALPDLMIRTHQQIPSENLYKFLCTFRGSVIFSLASENNIGKLIELLNHMEITLKRISHLSEASVNGCYLMIGAAEHGFIDTMNNRALICENDLLGNLIDHHYPKSCHSNSYCALTDHEEGLHIGQPVVHIEHGIGRYSGMVILEVGGVKGEYMMLTYANDTKLYVPVYSLHLISRYTGGTERNAPLHKLGSDTWIRAKQKAAEKVHDIAAELLEIYAQRATKEGFAFKYNSKQYQLFCDSFPFKTTPDQAQAINDVLNDMSQPLAMDRLVCGDVGFGKTEVALRAAFIAVENNKQVAIFAPTTLLAQQLFNNFRNRIANWPVRIEMLSRFRSTKDQLKILEQTANGKINILIGTHKLMQANVKWQDLGLLIFDEEHRFGVLHKERIKSIYSNIDILTLTATPIPRTLNMAISGIRDLSIIATPPARRLSVKTFVREYNNIVVREAIMREILRGGQVYYLFNDIKNIQKAKNKLTALVPEANIIVGHGQMREYELEQIMNDFHHQRFNVLVCTSIIEAGIDIPTANTIIIERADHFGLAQLHQLRGRVGRSHHQAYAWLLIPSAKTITLDAQKRLEVISSLENLGAGFSLAIHDLEIRGAGELLGKDQSGSMESIGFSLYMELLENAINAIKAGHNPSVENTNNQQTEVDLHIPSLLPDKFIPDVNVRLLFYKRIAQAKTETELKKIKIELIERFGPLLDPVSNLLEISSLRQQAQKIGIRKLKSNEKGGVIEFAEKNYVNPVKLVSLLQKQPQNFRLENSTCLKFIQELKDHKTRINWVRNFIHKLTEDTITEQIVK